MLQWNVWYQEDIQRVGTFLEHHPADIICLQELTRGYQARHSDTLDYIAQSLGFNVHFQEMGFDGKTWSRANAIFSRFPIRTASAHWINEPLGSGHYDDEYRSYIEATIDMGSRLITVGTTHMSYTNGFEGSARKDNETGTLISYLERNKRDFIFTGDINSPTQSATNEAISSVLRDAGPGHHDKTWTTKPFSYDGFSENDLNWRLDYIFSTPDITVLSSEVLQTPVSDHLPVLALFRI